MTTRNAIGTVGGAWFGSGLWCTLMSVSHAHAADLEVFGFVCLLAGGAQFGWAATR